MIGKLRTVIGEQARATGTPLGWLLFAAAILHVGVTLRAVNPWHPDEHFQILEFAWARAGLAPLSDLPWEFPARIRPTVQPTLAIGALAALRGVGVASPYPWVLALRLGTLVLALGVLVYVAARAAPQLSARGRRVLWLSALLLWFMPLLGSRFTSENWSGLALAAAIPLLESEPRRARDLGAGALLGFAFITRFQVAFACAALVLWLLVSRGPERRARAARVTAAALAVLAVGVVCDAWFYGAWVFTPWEYLRTNLIEGVASRFGTEPWYWYLVQTPLWTAPPLGIALLLLCIAAVIGRARSPWVWASVAFLLGHSVIAHKELRFLFPLIYAVPVLIALGADVVLDWATERSGTVVDVAPRWLRALGWTVAAQSVGLAALLLTPSVHRGKEFDWHFYRFLWETAEARPGDTIYVLQSEEGPYRVYELEGHVYRHPRVRGITYGRERSVAALVPAGTPPEDVLIVTRDRRPPRLEGTSGFELVYTAESGYRSMARTLGFEDAAVVDWIERVDRWVDSQWVRHVYRAASGPPPEADAAERPAAGRAS